jgi:hypothetical protein
LSTRETVATDTPARRATSRIVTLTSSRQKEEWRSSRPDGNVYMKTFSLIRPVHLPVKPLVENGGKDAEDAGSPASSASFP